MTHPMVEPHARDVDAEAGFKLGRYQVLKHLASGGMAQVLIARASGIEGFERHVVIKRIHKEHARDEQTVKMFLDEARLAASLHHTNIVQVHDIGQEQGEYFFAMEYVHGEDLRRMLTQVSRKHETIPLEHVITIIMSAAAALHYAHEHRGPDRKPLGIVHRDVSPANVLVAYDGNVKVVDFGIAKAALRSAETRSGTLKGKISYMAPEQCMGNAVDRRSDVFALGIVLYELVLVRRLFKGSSDFLTMGAIVAGNIPKPSLHRPDLPPALEAIMMKALALSPEDRYQTADEMRVALEEFATAANLRASTTSLADYMRHVFGDRPEPWLVEGNTPEVDVDFDGDGDGLGVKSGVRISTPPLGSLMARARRKDARPAGIPIMAEAAPEIAVATGWNASDKAPTTASGTPLAWTAVAPEPTLAPRRRWGILAGALAALSIAAIVVVVATHGGPEPDGTAAATAPARTVPTAPPEPAAVAATPEPATVATPSPAPTPPAAANDRAGSAAVDPPPTVVAAKPPAHAVAAKPVKRAKPTKPTTTTPKTKPGSWDPTALLPN